MTTVGSRSYNSSAKMQEITIDLKKLSEEFDALGVPTFQTYSFLELSTIEQLIHSTCVLIQMYRKQLKAAGDFHLNKAKQDTLHVKLNEYIDSCRNELSARDDEIKKLKHELFKIKDDCTETIDQNKKLLVQLTQTKAAYKAKIQEHEHIVHHLQNEIEGLKEKCGETIGKYKSSDSTVSECILKYKNREEIYKETIAKLQHNNRQLMEEVLNLKHDILIYMCKDNKLENEDIS